MQVCNLDRFNGAFTAQWLLVLILLLLFPSLACLEVANGSCGEERGLENNLYQPGDAIIGAVLSLTLRNMFANDFQKQPEMKAHHFS